MNTPVTLCPGGPTLSRVIFGTWRLLDEPTTATADGLLHRLHACVQAGITTLDTAEIYGGYRTEELLGEALRREAPSFRDSLQIITKCGIYVPCEFHPQRTVAFYNADAARIRKSAEKSLRLLGVDHLEVFLIHRPDWLTGFDETAAGLNALLQEGKILHAGVSNFSVSQFEALNVRMDKPLVTNQVEFSLLHLDPMFNGVFDHAQQHRYRPMAWSPLARGALLDETQEAGGRLGELCARLSPKYGGATVDQLALAWILAHPSGALPIIGTHRKKRILAAAQASQIVLEREDWYALWTAAQGRTIP